MKGVRRLAVEQAMVRLNIQSLKQFVDLLNKESRKLNAGVEFKYATIVAYITGHNDMSLKRLRIMSSLLRVPDLLELNEKFTPPRVRGCGNDWVGSEGSIVKDKDCTNLFYK